MRKKLPFYIAMIAFLGALQACSSKPEPPIVRMAVICDLTMSTEVDDVPRWVQERSLPLMDYFLPEKSQIAFFPVTEDHFVDPIFDFEYGYKHWVNGAEGLWNSELNGIKIELAQTIATRGEYDAGKDRKDQLTSCIDNTILAACKFLQAPVYEEETQCERRLVIISDLFEQCSLSETMNEKFDMDKKAGRERVAGNDPKGITAELKETYHLTDVEVLVHQMPPKEDKPTEMELRNFWTSWLKKMGATKVMFENEIPHGFIPAL